MIRRGFVDVRDGQIHYRTCGESAVDHLPLVMLHASPGSSRALEPLLRQLGHTRRVIAPDTLGNGDSSRALPESPDIPYFAGGLLQALDALGLDRFDLYGTHTGACIASEFVLQYPSRVRRLILDGVPMYSESERQERLSSHAPPVQPMEDGSQFVWAWHFVRDRFLFYPWYHRDRAHRRDVDFPTAQTLHDMTLDVLKALRTYHLSYNSVFRYHIEERLGRITIPTLVTVAASDVLYPLLDRAAARVPNCRKAVTPGISSERDLLETVDVLLSFLDA